MNYKNWIIPGITLVSLTACGGGGSSSTSFVPRPVATGVEKVSYPLATPTPFIIPVTCSGDVCTAVLQ